MLQEAIDILKREKPSDQLHQTLVEASQQHPYSSTLKTLLARTAHVNHDLRFEEFIREAAIRTHNRKKLHDFIYQTFDSAANEKEEIAERNRRPLETISEPKEVSHQEKNSETKEEFKEESNEKPPQNDNIKEFEQQFLGEVLAAGAAIELLQPNDEPEESNTEDSSKDQNEPTSTAKISAEPDSFISDQGQTESFTEEPMPTSTNEKHSLSDWLNMIDESTPASTANFDSSLDDASQSKEPLSEKDDTDTSLKNERDIISDFIENEDEIVPKRAEFFNPSKAAKNSLTDNDEIVTETLANIYAAQGNIKKAIATYEKLSLLHPEKSAYFAALVKKVKGQS